MLYYRYRPGKALSMKELIYNEMYFSSVSECNDPYEGQIFAEFEKNTSNWKKLINTAVKSSYVRSSPVEIPHSLIEKLVDCCVAMSPIDVNTFNTLNYKDFRLEVSIDDIFSDNQQSETHSLFEAIFEAIDRIKHYVQINLPAEQYFVSFSKKRDDILMWAHYANNHRGYCLVFRPIGNKIMPNKHWMKKGFTFDTPQSHLSDNEITFHIPEGFDLYDVKYTNEQTPPINAFALFPHVIDPEHHSKEVNDAMKVAYDSYLRKHRAWSYEEETRLLLLKNVPQYFANRTISLSSHQRLFHYDPSQLVGIILGVKMPLEQKKQIKEILEQKVAILNSESKKHGHPVDIAIFEARLSVDTIKINIDPVEICTSNGAFNQSHSNFKQLFNDWKTKNQWDFSKEEKL